MVLGRYYNSLILTNNTMANETSNTKQGKSFFLKAGQSALLWDNGKVSS
jgi:hypothetical protein